MNDIAIDKNILKILSNRPQYTQIESNRLVFYADDIFSRRQYILDSACQPLINMVNAANRNNIVLQVVSIFRSVEQQENIIKRKIQQGIPLIKIIDTVAFPGYSEHHTGRAVDFTTEDEKDCLTDKFDQTQAFKWLSSNAAQYRFYMSYPKKNQYNMSYEPWHWCFKG